MDFFIKFDNFEPNEEFELYIEQSLLEIKNSNHNYKQCFVEINKDNLDFVAKIKYKRYSKEVESPIVRSQNLFKTIDLIKKEALEIVYNDLLSDSA